MVAFADIIDFLLTLLTDEEAAAEFDKDPNGALRDAGLEGVSAADIRDARLQLADSGAISATDDGRGSAHPDGDDPVREIGYTTQHYVADENDLSLVERGDTFVTIDDRDSFFFQSISDDDITVDASTNNQLAIQDNDVTVSDDDTVINAEDSFNSDDDLVAIQDNDVNGGDEVIDIDVTGGVTGEPDEPVADPAADLAAVSRPAEEPADDLAAVSEPADPGFDPGPVEPDPVAEQADAEDLAAEDTAGDLTTDDALPV